MPHLVDVLYLIALATAGPFFLLRRLITGRRLAPLRARLCGFPELPRDGRTLWIHGVSVGEILAARGIVAALRRERPEARVVLSVTTRAGYDVARREYPDLTVFYSPLDLGLAVRRCLRRVSPGLLVLMELELWPNLLHYCREAGVPVAVANGKMSERSARGYRKVLRVLPRFLDGLTAVCVQHGTFRDRLTDLGFPAHRVHVTGSVKVDNLPLVPETEHARRLREELGLKGPVVVAGSTHDGEESAIFRAYLVLEKRVPDLRLVVAPRHLERLPRIEAEARELDLETVRWSRVSGDLSAAVVLVDTMGELSSLFAVADVVFLGGSLAKVGGHNLLEPAAQGKPVVFGPHVSTVREVADELVRGGGGFQVAGEADLTLTLERLLEQSDERDAAGRAALELVDASRGATERTMEVVLGLTGPERETPETPTAEEPSPVEVRSSR